MRKNVFRAKGLTLLLTAVPACAADVGRIC